MSGSSSTTQPFSLQKIRLRNVNPTPWNLFLKQTNTLSFYYFELEKAFKKLNTVHASSGSLPKLYLLICYKGEGMGVTEQDYGLPKIFPEQVKTKKEQ